MPPPEGERLGEGAPAPDAASDVELGELRVLDGPNRFFARPAVKLEFVGAQPGAAAAAAERAADAVQHLFAALDLPLPRLTHRRSHDDLRATVAYPWRRRAIAQSIGAAAARVALGRSGVDRELRGLRAVAWGPLPALPRPRIPLIAVTGTNGKSTTTRLIAHVCTGAGKRVGMTNSDGIFVDGELVEAGDWTGFGGAARVLAEPGIDVAVLETARGGILLRGIGYAANDVAVVTNISADHLGLQGVDTLEELAETKGAIVRITRRDGWAVLNSDDPRVWAMRHETKARTYAFSLDDRSPGVAEALSEEGRAAVVKDGWLVLRGGGGRPFRLGQAGEFPVTFAGLSRYNIANALAAAAACDAIGIPRRLIRAGLRSFAQDEATNPGRLNLYERDGVLALVDFAHNEEGLTGLLATARALVGRRGVVRLGLGTAGDRTDEILHRLGVVSGEGADEVVIAEKLHYLRGRDRHEMNRILARGVAEGSGGDPDEVEIFGTEQAALEALIARCRPGDAALVMSHSERAELFAWLRDVGFRPVSPDRLRELVRGHARDE